ncbi:MAG: glycosyl transferase [Proteobacteria bacterium]|nr:MAG: glycosyl transferase [Pseudomonadota bacterium]
MGTLGVVVIGRNEGERLARCLASIAPAPVPVVYVDSGSSDGSPALARSRGADVVELDASLPFTAARGRNAGFDRLRRTHADLALVQFVDGDCELASGWLDAAAAHLAAHPDVGVVFGRRRERHPEASPWNRCADVEWDGLPGEAQACGGDALMRASVLVEAGGYDPALIAGEEPDLCMRIRRNGWRIVRLDREMTLHDAALLRFRQWWRRQVRSGHAYAETAWRHRASPDRTRARRVASIAFWAGLLPAAALALAIPTRGASLLLLLAEARPWLGLYRAARRRRTQRDALLYASACLLGKVAELRGVLAFAWNQGVRRRATALIEYKGMDARPR